MRDQSGVLGVVAFEEGRIVRVTSKYKMEAGSVALWQPRCDFTCLQMYRHPDLNS